jgi:hypothetical protein
MTQKLSLILYLMEKTSENSSKTEISEGIQGRLITVMVSVILGVIGILAQRREVKKTEEKKQQESVEQIA